MKKKYRARLHDGLNGAEVVYLKGSHELPLSARKAHFMKADMLQSQFEALEEPQNALVLDASM